MKIAVYTICKNESAFVDRWVDSMSEADGIFVLDTGSEDDTVEKLKARGVTVGEAEIIPWRFDTARNLSLELVPKDFDVCVCTDLDEVFLPGWRRKIEKPGKTAILRQGLDIHGASTTTEAKALYFGRKIYMPALDSDGPIPYTKFFSERIHPFLRK